MARLSPSHSFQAQDAVAISPVGLRCWGAIKGSPLETGKEIAKKENRL
jgi:hypothetical protein